MRTPPELTARCSRASPSPSTPTRAWSSARTSASERGGSGVSPLELERLRVWVFGAIWGCLLGRDERNGSELELGEAELEPERVRRRRGRPHRAPRAAGWR